MSAPPPDIKVSIYEVLSASDLSVALASAMNNDALFRVRLARQPPLASCTVAVDDSLLTLFEATFSALAYCYKDSEARREYDSEECYLTRIAAEYWHNRELRAVFQQFRASGDEEMTPIDINEEYESTAERFMKACCEGSEAAHSVWAECKAKSSNHSKRLKALRHGISTVTSSLSAAFVRSPSAPCEIPTIELVLPTDLGPIDYQPIKPSLYPDAIDALSDFARLFDSQFAATDEVTVDFSAPSSEKTIHFRIDVSRRQHRSGTSALGDIFFTLGKELAPRNHFCPLRNAGSSDVEVTIFKKELDLLEATVKNLKVCLDAAKAEIYALTQLADVQMDLLRAAASNNPIMINLLQGESIAIEELIATAIPAMWELQNSRNSAEAALAWSIDAAHVETLTQATQEVVKYQSALAIACVEKRVVAASVVATCLAPRILRERVAAMTLSYSATRASNELEAASHDRDEARKKLDEANRLVTSVKLDAAKRIEFAEKQARDAQKAYKEKDIVVEDLKRKTAKIEADAASDAKKIADEAAHQAELDRLPCTCGEAANKKLMKGDVTGFCCKSGTCKCKKFDRSCTEACHQYTKDMNFLAIFTTCCKNDKNDTSLVAAAKEKLKASGNHTHNSQHLYRTPIANVVMTSAATANQPEPGPISSLPQVSPPPTSVIMQSATAQPAPILFNPRAMLQFQATPGTTPSEDESDAVGSAMLDESDATGGALSDDRGPASQGTVQIGGVLRSDENYGAVSRHDFGDE